MRASILLVSSFFACTCAPKEVTKAVEMGDTRDLRERPEAVPERAGGAAMLILALDGVPRELLYRLLEAGELPELERLLGGRAADGALAHAHLDETVLTTLPSSTAVAWAAAFTGRPPAENGITGNELFVRERRAFVAPVPTSFDDMGPAISIYTDDLLQPHLRQPTVYERMRTEEPEILVWVAMSQFFGGADRLLFVGRDILLDAVEGLVDGLIDEVTGDRVWHRWETLDDAITSSVVDALDEDGAVPDVLTVYFPGPDLYGHVAGGDAWEAIAAYLREVVDGNIGRIAKALQARGAIDDRYVLVISDHGHTDVHEADGNALEGERSGGEPGGVATRAGYRVRPFGADTDAEDYQVVLAYQGAMAYAYVADRSSCPEPDQPCDWGRPPRLGEDVLPLAQAFHEANTRESAEPGMRGTLDLILVRDADGDLTVYEGDGERVPLARYLERHPQPDYVNLERRLRALVDGPAGDRAGDLILLAHLGDRERERRRYYFSRPYGSMHGSPSARDSEIVFILAHPRRSAAELARRTRRVLGDHPDITGVTDLMLDLRRRP